MCTSEPTLLQEVFSSIEYKFRNLPSLYPSAIGAIRGALKLDSHFAALNLCHAFLSEVAEFVAVQYHAGCVEGVWLNLHRILKPHREGIAGAIGEVLAQVLPQDNALPFEFDLGTVLRRATAGAIQPEARDEHSLIHCELNAVTAAPIAPLVAPISTGLETVTALGDEALAGFAHKLQLGLLGRSVPEEDIVGLIES